MAQLSSSITAAAARSSTKRLASVCVLFAQSDMHELARKVIAESTSAGFYTKILYIESVFTSAD